MDSVESIMMMRLSTFTVGGFWFGIQRQTGSAEQAGYAVRTIHPCFGNPDDFPEHPGRPLPIELKQRIEIYSKNRRTTDSAGFGNEIERHRNFNALIRAAIQAGNL
jgi:hypothetical protein